MKYISEDTNVGYGIIRLSFDLADRVLPECRIEETTMQRDLRDAGYFATVKERLLLPESYEILGIYIEPYQLCWSIVVKSPEIPRVNEGALLPHCTPIYTHSFNMIDGTRSSSLTRIEIERHDRVLKVD